MSDFLTDVVLYQGIPFDKSYNHTIYFTSLTDQANYFASKEVDAYHKFTDMSYQRIDKNTIRVQLGYEDVVYCNYLSIKNRKSSGTQKTYYCFIDNVTYVSDNVSEISYTVDIMQTYHPYQSYYFGECWIERQHSESDEKGEHLEDDYLIGDYTYNITNNSGTVKGKKDVYLNGNVNYNIIDGHVRSMTDNYENDRTATFQFSCEYAVVMGILKDITRPHSSNGGIGEPSMYDNLPSSVKLIAVPIASGDIYISYGGIQEHHTFNTLTNINTLMNHTMTTSADASATNYDDVAFMIVVPIKNLNIVSGSWSSYTTYITDSSTLLPINAETYTMYCDINPTTFAFSPAYVDFNQNDRLDGYLPLNNKLWNYPYNMMTVTNLNGQTKDYKIHEFENEDNRTGRIITPNPYTSVDFYVFAYFNGGNFEFVLVPYKYEHREKSIDNAILTTDFPTVSWINNTYQTWLEQKSAQNILSMVQGVAQFGLGIAQIGAGSKVSGTARIISGASNVANSIDERRVASTLPNTINGQMSNCFNYAKGSGIGFQIINRCLRKEFIEQIDNYFTMYGYAMKQYNHPKLDARKYYTYIQTAGCIIKPLDSGKGMPSSVQRQIADIYDKGITFWRYSTTDGITNPDVGNYGYNPCFADH